MYITIEKRYFHGPGSVARLDDERGRIRLRPVRKQWSSRTHRMVQTYRLNPGTYEVRDRGRTRTVVVPPKQDDGMPCDRCGTVSEVLWASDWTLENERNPSLPEYRGATGICTACFRLWHGREPRLPKASYRPWEIDESDIRLY